MRNAKPPKAVTVQLDDLGPRVMAIAGKLGVKAPDVIRMAMRAGFPIPKSGTDEERKLASEQSKLARRALEVAA